VCNKSPPNDYERKVLQDEARLGNLAEFAKKWYNERNSSNRAKDDDFQIMGAFLSRFKHHIEAVTCHSMYSALLEFQGDKGKLLDATETMVTPYQTLTFPSEQALATNAMATELFCATETQEGLQRALISGRAAMRIARLVTGGKLRHNKMDTLLTHILSALPPQPPTLTQCAFCGVDPLLMEVSLTPCAACNQVAYCSVECKQMHGGVHSKSCGGVC
jgi:hypothetical protein